MRSILPDNMNLHLITCGTNIIYLYASHVNIHKQTYS